MPSSGAKASKEKSSMYHGSPPPMSIILVIKMVRSLKWQVIEEAGQGHVELHWIAVSRWKEQMKN
jgi:hypothetical protein